MFYLHYENDWISWHKGTPENCILLQCKRIYGICLIELQFLNMNCWEFFWLDLNLVQVIAGLKWWRLEKYQRISWVQNEEMKRRKDYSGYKGNGRRTRTLRTVLILGGEDVTSLLHSPNILVIFKYVLYLFAGEELKAKAPPVTLFLC